MGHGVLGAHARLFDEIDPPRFARTSHNPALLLDSRTVHLDALLGHYLAERAVLREVTPHIPITTNFMVMGMNDVGVNDYRRWSDEVDLVANDHYTLRPLSRCGTATSPSARTACAVCRTGVPGCSSSTRPRRSTGRDQPGQVGGPAHTEQIRTSRAAPTARCYFQWRQSDPARSSGIPGSSPHTGADSKVYRDIETRALRCAGSRPLLGSTVAPARIAILFDHQARGGPALESDAE